DGNESSTLAKRLVRLRRLDRKPLLRLKRPRRAILRHWAQDAGWAAWGADRGAEIHHRLCEIAGARVGKQVLDHGADFRLGRGKGRLDCPQAGDHPLHITIYYGGRAVEGDRGDGRSRVVADAGQILQAGFGIGKLASVE